MRVEDAVARRITAIAGDRERGATELAREALDVLREAAEMGNLGRLPEIASALATARPAMAAIANAVRRVADDPAALASAEAAVAACAHAREWLDYSSSVVAGNAADLLPQNATIVTCSYSSGVLQALAQAAPERQARVRALESRVGLIPYGERLAMRLRDAGVACEVIADEGLEDALDGATLVLVGADRVLPSGTLVNGIPSLALAQGAQGRAVPFYALCESFKLDESRTLERGFDLVPSGLVTAYVTEHGVTPPAEVWAVHQRV